jgi:hypothetical protein
MNRVKMQEAIFFSFFLFVFPVRLGKAQIFEIYVKQLYFVDLMNLIRKHL